MGFPHSLVGKEPFCNAGDPGLMPGSERSPGEMIGCPRQYSWASLVAQLVKNLICLQCRRPGFIPWVGQIPWRRERLTTPVFWSGEFHGLYSPWGRKELDTTERLSGEGDGSPLQDSCLANPMGGGAWRAAVHGVAKGWT